MAPEASSDSPIRLASSDLGALRDFITTDASLASLYEEVEGRLGDDPGHDMGHNLRVALWTLRLSQGEVDPRLAVAAALLHDVVNLPKDAPHRERASELSAQVAEGVLPALGFSVEQVREVCHAVREHSFSRGGTPETALGRALQDADRLEALGAIGLFRTLSAGARMGAIFFDAADPWARRRDLDDTRFTVDHFFKKLLGLHRTMHTERGRSEARQRTIAMLELLKQLGHELDEELPRADLRDSRRPPPGDAAEVAIPRGAGLPKQDE